VVLHQLACGNEGVREHRFERTGIETWTVVGCILALKAAGRLLTRSRMTGWETADPTFHSSSASHIVHLGSSANCTALANRSCAHGPRREPHSMPF
jgi:hypothetical protein